ncbi:PucR family transcriptional regulator [Brevibacillus migulae]|uniref:PucR family transcriptional regulator n=1 Tax=Brevibacillus migulae TaxID=1644114 RepID=UPI00106E452A|nr:helix-turn-helix domain-containing protein [Brevibacillus migulae]
MSVQPNYFEQFQHVDIDDLADAIGEVLENPITIEDADHKLIAYSSHGESTDPARWSTIMGRRVPEKVLTRLWKEGIFQRLLTEDRPVHIPAFDDVGLGKRVAIAIRKGEEVLGYIWAQEVNRPISTEDDEILRQAARAAVARLVQRQGKRKAEEQRRKDFFWELLLGNPASEAQIRRKAESLHMILPQPFQICIIDAPNGQLDRYFYPFIMREKLMSVSDGTQLILLMGKISPQPIDSEALHQSTEQFLRELLEKWEQRGDAGKLLAGYGQAYSSYQEMGRSYREALQVIKLKRLFEAETAQIYGYHDLGIYRYLLQLKRWSEADGYQNVRLQRLKRYDRDNQSNLLETLETYLDAAGKVNSTAQRLHIHINTLSYRLRRIEEIMQVDLDNQNQRTALYLDLKADKLGKEQ